MPTQKIALQLSLQNAQQVINGINQITLAWVSQHKSITKNYLQLMEILRDMGKQETDLAMKALNANTAMSNMGAFSAGVIGTKLVGGIDKASKSLENLSGKFDWVGKSAKAAGTIIGGIIGAIVGNLPGMAFGAALGGAVLGFFGNIYGALFDLPNKAFNVVSSVVKTVLGGVKNIAEGFLSIGTSVKNLIFGPISLFGLGIGSFFKSLSQGISETIGEVWNAAADFQRLTISLETMTRREIARQQQIDITKVSTEELAGATEELLTWMKQVSLTSPFTMASIAQSTKFASAMGLTMDMTKDLVWATGNFSAAMGLEEDHQERIMYNMAQIYQQGKLTGREFRDLAISFVPVYDILGEMAKEAGTTTEAFKKLALEGGVPVQDFFKHYIDYMNRNFPDAMKKMAHTWQGVQNNIKDFIQVILGMEILGPTLDSISSRIADVLDKLMTPKAHRMAMDLGEGLKRGFDIAAEAADGLGKAVMELLGIFGFAKPTFNDFATAWVKIVLTIKYAINFISYIVRTIKHGVEDIILPTIRSLGTAGKVSGSWGANIMKNFAEGLIKGAAVFLARAFIFIKAMIVGFFGPGSPPDAAPDIDKWGAETINEWIGGMIEGANWNKLNEIGEITQGYVQNVQVQGGIPYEPGDTTPTPPGGGAIGPTTPLLPGQGAMPYEPGVGTIVPKAAQIVKKAANAVSNAVKQFIPFITEQGMKIAAAFMHGFTDADFTVLDEIQNPLKSAIDALVGLGSIAEEDSFKMFYNFSQDLISAIDQFNKDGKISSKLLSEISRLGMGLGPEMADLVVKEFNLSTAIKDAEKAQIRLNNAIEALSKAHKTVRLVVGEYNALLRAGADKSVLKAKLKQVNAAELSVKAAREEKVKAEENKKLADERVDRMKELVSLQSKLVDNMIELLNTQVDAMSKFKSDAAGAGDALEDLMQDIGDVGSALGEGLTGFDWDKTFKELEPDFVKAFSEYVSLFQTTFTEAMGDVKTQTAADIFVNNLKNSIAKALGINVGEDIQEGFKPISKPSFFQQIIDKIGDALSTASWEKIKTAIGDKLLTIWKENWTTIVPILGAWLIGGPGWGILVGGIILGLKKAIQKYPGLLVFFTGLLSHSLPLIMAGIVEIANEAVAKEDMPDWSNTMDEAIKGFFNPTKPPKTPELPGIGFAESIIGGIDTTVKDEDFVTLGTRLQEVWTSISDYVTTWKPLKPAKGKANVGGSLISTILSGLIDLIPNGLQENNVGEELATQTGAQIESDNNTDIWLLAIKTTAEKMLASLITTVLPGWFVLTDNNVGANIATNIDTQVTSETNQQTWKDAIKETANKMLDNLIRAVLPDWFFSNDVGLKIATETDNQINNNSETFMGLGTSIVESIGAGILSATQWLGNKINELVQAAIAWYKANFQHSPIEVFYDLGGDMAESISAGIESGAKGIKKSLSNTISDASKIVGTSNVVRGAQATFIPQRVTNAPVVNKSTNVNFGDVYLNNNMDWATFKSRVHRAITE